MYLYILVLYIMTFSLLGCFFDIAIKLLDLEHYMYAVVCLSL